MSRSEEPLPKIDLKECALKKENLIDLFEFCHIIFV